MGGRVITKLRNRLSDESARASIVLASWLKNPAFNARREMKEFLENQWKRGKGAERNGSAIEVIELEDWCNCTIFHPYILIYELLMSLNWSFVFCNYETNCWKWILFSFLSRATTFLEVRRRSCFFCFIKLLLLTHKLLCQWSAD